MAEFLVIRLGEDADRPVSWIAVDSRGTRRSNPGSGSLADAATQVGDREVIVLVPASEVATHTVDIPVKGARLLAALPYALEDQVAEDVDTLHFAPGKRLPDGRLTVAVVAQDVMAGWVTRLAEAGIEASAIVPENHGLAVTPNTMSMLVADGELFFNDGAGINFAIPGMAPADALAAAGLSDDAEGDTPRHLLVYCDSALSDRFEKDWALLRTSLASVDVNLLPDGILPRLAVTVASGAGVNLLQGRYGSRTDVVAMLRPWKAAAVFVGVLLVVGLLGKAADYYRLSKEVAALQEQFTSQYRELQPNDTRDVVDPIAAVTSLRRSIGSSSGGSQVFLPSLAELATALRNNNQAVVEAISYRAGVINVRLNAPDIPTLDRIVQAMSASGRFSASLESADTVGDRVNSRIEIRESGA